MLFLTVGFLLCGHTTLSTVNLSEFDIYTPQLTVAVNENNVLALLKDDTEKTMLLVDGNTGTLMAKCGRKGSGPKEFGSPDAVWWSPSSATFCVYDSEHGRVSQWNQQGHFMSVTKVDHKLKNPTLRVDGKLMFTRNRAGIFMEKPALMQWSDADDQARVFWSAPDTWFQAPRARIDGRVMVVSREWDPTLLYAVGEDFVVVAYTIDNRLQVFDLKGQRQRVFAVDLKQYAVTDAEIEQQIDKAFPMVRSALRARRDELYSDANWPEIRDLFVDSQNRIWVVGQPERTDARRTPITMFNSNGRILQAIYLPTPPRALSADSVFVIVPDGDDLYLNRLALPE